MHILAKYISSLPEQLCNSIHQGLLLKLLPFQDKLFSCIAAPRERSILLINIITVREKLDFLLHGQLLLGHTTINLIKAPKMLLLIYYMVLINWVYSNYQET